MDFASLAAVGAIVQAVIAETNAVLRLAIHTKFLAGTLVFRSIALETQHPAFHVSLLGPLASI
jgi:hypothetical protein